jgi:hypothetical protein
MAEQITKILVELENYEKELYAASVEYKDLARDAAEKRATYDVAWAQELLKIPNDKDHKMTVGEKEALVTQLVQTQLRSARIAESLAEGAKRHLSALQSNLTSIQTRASLLKTERSLVNMYA